MSEVRGSGTDLVRLDALRGAVLARCGNARESEAAPDGTVETMEDLVCAVHREPAPHHRRADLLANGM